MTVQFESTITTVAFSSDETAPTFDTTTTTVSFGESSTPGPHAAAHADGGSDPLTPAAIGAIPASLIDAKGDLLAGTADNTVARLPVGANGLALVADSAEAAGLKFAAPAPAAHAASHADGGSDEITVAESQVTGLTSALAGKTDDADLPYSAVVPAIVPVAASNVAATQEYFATCIFNCRAFTNTAIDNYMEWTVFVAAGTYTLRTVWRSNTNAGIASISIDGGAALGTTIDTYAAAAASNNITDITGIALTAGRHTIRYTGATKNASSTAYGITLHGFTLTRTGA